MLQKLSSMKTALRAMTAAAVLGSTSVGAMACGTDPYVGEICTFAFDYCPKGFLPANGAVLNPLQYTALFGLLGTKFGGDGKTTFQLPDLRGRTPVGSGLGKGLNNPVLIGESSGTETVTLMTLNMPAHIHTLANIQASGTVVTQVTVNALTTETASAASAPSASASTIGKIGTSFPAYYPYNPTKAVPVPVTAYVNSVGDAANTVTLPVTGTMTPAGGSQPFSALSPRLGVTFCIATQGIFPPRP